MKKIQFSFVVFAALFSECVHAEYEWRAVVPSNTTNAQYGVERTTTTNQAWSVPESVLTTVDVKPQKYYGKIARRFGDMLPRYHVLQQSLNDEISQRAWTNLVTFYDFDHSVFLKGDLERLSAHEKTIDDEIRSGNVNTRSTISMFGGFASASTSRRTCSRPQRGNGISQRKRTTASSGRMPPGRQRWKKRTNTGASG